MDDDPKRVAVVGSNMSLMASLAAMMGGLPTPAVALSPVFGGEPRFRGPSSSVNQGPPKLSGRRLERLKKQCAVKPREHTVILYPLDLTQPAGFQNRHKTDYLDEILVFDKRCPRCLFDKG